MIVLVCGSREDTGQRGQVWAALDRLHAERRITRLVHGAATGVDAMASQWALANGVDNVSYHADWKTHGRAAGPIRNAKMLVEGRPDLVVVFPGDTGTKDMRDKAKAKGVRIATVTGMPPVIDMGLPEQSDQLRLF